MRTIPPDVTHILPGCRASLIERLHGIIDAQLDDFEQQSMKLYAKEVYAFAYAYSIHVWDVLESGQADPRDRTRIFGWDSNSFQDLFANLFLSRWVDRVVKARKS